MPQELMNKLKMLGRYTITAGVMYAAGAGWIKPDAAGPVTSFLLEFGAMSIAALPPLYAWLKVKNDKKFSRRTR